MHQRTGWNVLCLVIAIFILIGLGIYFNSLQNDFHYDDGHHIVKNFYIRSLGNIPLFFTEPKTFSSLSGQFRHYRPLVLLSYAVNYYLAGLNPIGYHLINLGFHIGSAFMVFLIMRVMVANGWTSLFTSLAAGLLFLTTPFNSEVVNYITARSSVMSTFLCLLAFYFWIKFRKNQTSYYFYIASLLTFTLAMLTKEVAIVLPLLVLLYDLYFKKISFPTFQNYRAILSYIPFLLAGVLVGFVLRRAFFGAFLSVRKREENFYFITKAKVLAKYCYATFVPAQLSIQHLIHDTLNIYFFLSIVLIIGLVILAYRLWRHSEQLGKMISFFILWFFISLLPVVAFSLTEPYQENRGYLAGVGLIGILAIGLEKLRIRWSQGGGLQKVLVYVLFGFLIILYSSGTIIRNTVWRNELTLWSDVMEKYPQSTTAYIQAGIYHSMVGNMGLAEKEYRTVLKIEPGNCAALNKLGALYYKKGVLDMAMEMLKKALECGPYYIDTHYFLARIYKEKGDLAQSSRHLLFVLNSSPHNIRVFEMLMENYASMGKLAIAHKMISKALEIDPGNPGARRAMGLIYMYQKQWTSAQVEFEKVLSYMPNDHQTLKDLRYIYHLQKKDLEP